MIKTMMHFFADHKGAFIIIIILVISLIFIEQIAASWIGIGFHPDKNRSMCPFAVAGSNNETVIKYFTRPDCPACWKEELSLRPFVSLQGEKMTLQKYDSRFCRIEKKEFGIRGTPSFIFLKNDSPAALSHFGYLDYGQLTGVIS